jgi:hypothetical protein
MNNLGQHEYRRIIKAAGVRPIKLHGLRHTCATLLAAAAARLSLRQQLRVIDEDKWFFYNFQWTLVRQETAGLTTYLLRRCLAFEALRC